MTSIDFVGQTRRWMTISAVLIAASLLSLGFNGLNLSIDFVGGSSFLVNDVTATGLVSGDLVDAVEALGAIDASAQISEGDAGTGVIVETATVELASDLEDNIQSTLLELTGGSSVDVTTVGPSWGQRISAKSLQALIVFIVVVMLYISLRLEPKMAGAAIVALAHDLVITIGAYAVFGFTVSPSTVIALLTILGYSLYDSVVVFDRVEENTATLGPIGRRSYGEAVNTSMNDVLWRSLNTSITSLLPVGALLFLGAGLLGATTLRDLALALFVGMAFGSYSSIFIAGPFLAWWKEKEPALAELKVKLERKIAAGETEARVDAASVVAGRAPITTEYVRGRGRKNKKRK